MPLSKLQLALVRLLQQAPTTTTTTAAALAPSEQRWLASLANTPGFRVTRDIRQWWRTIRLQTAAPLTLRLLQHSDKAAWIEHYLATARCESLFFATEALAFLNFVMAQNTDDANLGAVAAFERALVRVHAQRERAVSVVPDASAFVRSNAVLTRHSLAALVIFPVRPERLLGSLVQNTPLAATSREQHHPVLIAPGVTHLWRLASPPEAELLARFTKPVTGSEIQRWPRATRELTASLYCEQALRIKSMH